MKISQYDQTQNVERIGITYRANSGALTFQQVRKWQSQAIGDYSGALNDPQLTSPPDIVPVQTSARGKVRGRAWQKSKEQMRIGGSASVSDWGDCFGSCT
jgi:hypothetical protein